MKKNLVLQEDVQKAILWEPLLAAAEIGVIAKDGVVTLSGTVDSYAKKIAAENAAKNVAGVKAVVEDIEIKFGSGDISSDNEVALEVLKALKANWEVPESQIKVKVENGRIALEGEVDWDFQRKAATESVHNLLGVKGVSNLMTIKPASADDIEKKDIEQALERNWAIDDQCVQVVVSENRVTLVGIVGSYYEKEEAARIAWNAPGVCSVDNELIIDFAE